MNISRRGFVKFGVASIAAAAMGTSMVGCSGGSAANTNTAAKAGRTIKVVTCGNAEPYSLVASDGKWTGMEPEMWAEVEKRLGAKVEMTATYDHTTVFGELAATRADVAANCYAINAKRLETYLACDPIYADAQVIAVKPDSSYKTYEDLRGKKIAVTSGQAAQTTVEKIAPDYNWEVVTYEDSTAAFQDVSLGRVDACANTVTNFQKAMKAQNLEFRFLDQKLYGNNVSWFLMPANKDLRDELNGVIAEMHKDGTLSAMTTKWFGEDLTKLISDEWLKADK